MSRDVTNLEAAVPAVGSCPRHRSERRPPVLAEDGPGGPAGTAGRPAKAGTTYSRQRRRVSARRFTLVEALMAILMLAIVTGIIVRLVGRVHQVWRSRRNLTEVYEEARVLFGVVSDDLRCAEATADGPPERQVRFHIEEDGELRFVTVGEPSPGASSRLIEVSYRVEDNQFKRAFRDTTSTDWWPYGERTAIASPTAEHILAERVIGYEVVCYHDDGTEWSTPSVPSEETGMPHAVRFNVTLLDRSSFNLWRQLTGARQTEYALANARTVTKRLFLGGGQ